MYRIVYKLIIVFIDEISKTVLQCFYGDHISFNGYSEQESDDDTAVQDVFTVRNTITLPLQSTDHVHLRMRSNDQKNKKKKEKRM